jgi:predicted RNase H-like HicB family nuclease
MEYLVVIELGDKGFGAYVPDLPGCIAAGDTKEEVLELIQEAIEFHIEDLQEQGAPIPTPASSAQVVQVGAA